MVTIPYRYRGPAWSGNGGYTAGLLGTASPAAVVTVTLRRPPPLDRTLSLVVDGESVTLSDGDVLLAEAVAGKFDEPAVEPVGPDDAVNAAARFAGFSQHPFPGCFVCGPERDVDDGLRIFAGSTDPDRTTEPDRVAAPWSPSTAVAGPDGVAPEIVWAALDCPGGWSFDIAGRPMVLGRTTTQVHEVPAVDEPCVVVGVCRRSEGRKAFTGSALYGANGNLLARSEATWIAVDPVAFQAPR